MVLGGIMYVECVSLTVLIEASFGMSVAKPWSESGCPLAGVILCLC